MGARHERNETDVATIQLGPEKLRWKASRRGRPHIDDRSSLPTVRLVPNPTMTEEQMKQVDQGVLEPRCEHFYVTAM